MRYEKLLVGSVQTLWQYPVKSMQGTELNEGVVTPQGLLGDRAHGLIDLTDGTVASAKNPRKWPRLLDFHAEYLERPRSDAPLPAVRITMPNGSTVVSNQPDAHRRLSEVLGRAVELRACAPTTPILQQLWPGEVEVVTDEAMPEGAFFDLAPFHLVTTSTLDQLRRLNPDTDFYPRRFRPNLVIATNPEFSGFVEQGWLGRTLLLGESVRLRVTGPTPRCVMTTLGQPGLAANAIVLRTVAQECKGNVGVYGAIIQGGPLRQDDPVWLEGGASSR